MIKMEVMGDAYCIQSVNLRGWRCYIYTSYSPTFITAHAEDDENIRVFVDFDAEFGFDWRDKESPDKLHKRAEQIACERLGALIEETVRTNRKRWRKRSR